MKMAERSNSNRAREPGAGVTRRAFIGGVGAAVALHASGCRPDARQAVSEHQAGGRMTTMSSSRRTPRPLTTTPPRWQQTAIRMKF
jgi:hypothetical protein